jgi:hypothetical protein
MSKYRCVAIFVLVDCAPVTVLVTLWDPGWYIAFPLPGMQIGHSINGEEVAGEEEDVWGLATVRAFATVLVFATVLWGPEWPITFPLSGMQSGHCICREETSPGWGRRRGGGKL